ncbi:hypothetical protein T484DRAFT_1852456 [Baffinella frigidus]|nr:hypothetical protein T484DRAFT_1852456 [Cryptophyta sp. CCMP2293]
MAESAASCSHCGKQDVVLKKCSVCKQASYCGTECQKAGWKRHKKTCTAPLPLTVVAGKLNAAHASGDWKTVLEHAGRMEEMMAHRTEAYCEAVLANFSHALRLGWNSTGSQDHARSFVALEERRIPILGNLQRFRDQGNSMCTLAIFFSVLHRGDVSPQSCVYFERARKVGEAHGFFTVECKACTGLGRAAMREGRHEEGVELLRNELVAARLNEMDDPKFELDSLDALIDALFATDAVDEAEPLVQRFREAAKEQSELV